MVKVANLSADLTANTASFDKRIARSRRSLASNGRAMSRNAANFNKSVSGSFRKAAASAAAFEGPLGGIAGRLSGLASIANTTGVAIGGALLALSGFGFVIGKAAKVADDFEGSMNRVNAVLKATRGASAQTAEGIREFSEQLALSTLASVEGVEAAAAKLLTFRRITGRTFKEAIILAQDLAAVYGGDLQANITRIGKALEDPITNLSALSRTGTTFTASQQSMIKSLVKSNRLLEAQDIILGELRQTVGGAGAAEGGPIAKGLDVLSQRLDDFFLSLDKTTGAGRVFTQFLTGFSNTLEGITGVLDPQGPTFIEQLASETEQLNAMLMQTADEIKFLESRPETAARAEETVQAAIDLQRGIVEGLKARVAGEDEAAAAIAARAKVEQDAIQAEFEAGKIAKAREAADKIFVKEQERKAARIRSSIDALQAEVNALRAEGQAFKDTAISIAEAATEREVLLQQQKLGVAVGGAEGETLEFLIRQRARLAAAITKEQDIRKRAAQIIEANKTETQKLNEEIREFNDLRMAGFLTEDQYQGAVTRTNEKIKELSESNKELERVLDNVSSTIQDTFIDFVTGAKTASDAVRGLGLELAKIALQETTKSLFGGPIKSGIKSLIGGFFADGGRPPMGQLSVVGENGPELFVPDSAGTIIPNDQIGGGGGPTIFADMRGASVEAVARLEAFVAELNGSIEPRAINAVAEERQRTPALFGGAS